MVAFLKNLPIYIEIYLPEMVDDKYSDIKFLENEGLRIKEICDKKFSQKLI